MKNTRPLLIVWLFMSLCSCSEEQPYEPEQKAITLWTGETGYVNIESDVTHCNYTLNTHNQEIVSATVHDEKKSVYIIAHKPGKTTIQLVDTDNNKILCEIAATINHFGSPEITEWGIPQDGQPGSPGIIVKAKDTDIQKKIEHELRTESLVFVFAIYSFDWNTKFTLTTESGLFYEGTYEWDFTSLTLRYDNKVEKYGFKFSDEMINGYVIQANKTEEYQQRYPDAGITEVKVNRVWHNSGKIPGGGLVS